MWVTLTAGERDRRVESEMPLYSSFAGATVKPPLCEEGDVREICGVAVVKHNSNSFQKRKEEMV